MEYPFVINNSSTVSVLWSEHRTLALPYVVIMGIATVVGTIGNLLVMGTLVLMSQRQQQGVGNIFVFNLALSDLIVTSLINPFSILGVVKGVSFFGPRFGLCRGLASVCVISCVVSLLTIGNIAMNRYIYICRHSLYNKIYSTHLMVSACVLAWIMGVLVDLPSHLGWSRHAFDEKSHKCIWDRKYRHEYTTLLVIAGVVVPLHIIIVFYVLIARHVRNAKLRLCRHSNASTQVKIMKVIRQTRMMFLIFLVFAICWIPYITVLLSDRNDELSVELHLSVTMFAHLHASFNWVIYGFGNASFRQGYKDIIRGLMCCKGTREQEVESIGGFSSVLEGRPLGFANWLQPDSSLVQNNDNLINQDDITDEMAQDLINIASPPPQEAACVIRASSPCPQGEIECYLGHKAS